MLYLKITDGDDHGFYNQFNEIGYKKCILETGERQVKAVKFYYKSNYNKMKRNYGQYKGVDNSLCFEKEM